MSHLVTVTSTDENGKFTYKGNLIQETDKGLSLRLGIGDMFFETGSYTVSYPEGYKAKVDAGAEKIRKEVKAKAKTKAKTKAPKKGTKIGKAVELLTAYKENKEFEQTRQGMIHYLMDHMEDMNDKVRASALYQSAMKKM
jgi:hypothetical protein